MKKVTGNIFSALKVIKFRVVFVVIFTLIFGTGTLLGQGNVNLTVKDVVMGKAEVSATTSITLSNGFQALNGSDFRAYINSSTAPVTNLNTVVSSPSSSATPVTGTNTLNFIKTITYQEAQTTVPSTAFRHLAEIQYLDGLGRPVQNVSVGASPLGNDIIQPILYDDLGRELYKTLPYTDTKSGAFRSGVNNATVNDYYYNKTPEGKIRDNRAYTQINYDNSPLNRVVSQVGMGDDWASKSTIINYLTNTSIGGWKASSDFSYSAITYAAGSLYVTETQDEQGNKTREYKDKLGQIVQKENLLGTQWLRTAYIYDDYGLLRCVVPPKASNPNTDQALCYYYLYDSRNRLIEKRIPGAGSTRMVYDSRDRLRFTQNALQRASSEWSYTKYDELNRPVITGVLKNKTETEINTALASGIQNEIRDNSTTQFGYNNASYPRSSETCEILSVTYYDDYTFIKTGLAPANLQSLSYDVAPYVFGDFTNVKAKGRVTGSMTKVLSHYLDGSSVPKTTLYSATFYDKYGNVLRTVAENHLGGRDILSNNYEPFTYRVLTTQQQHINGTENIIINKAFEYDHAGRLLATRQKINNQPEITLNSMKYNEVGELVTKYLHSDETTSTRSFRQKVDFKYNIRGWLTQINDPTLSTDNDIFGMQFFHQKTTDLGGLSSIQSQFNGNISGMKWNIKNDVVNGRGYSFTYDSLNRFRLATYKDGPSLDENINWYNEEITGYDKNGNIIGLKRNYKNILVDNLSYEYKNTNASNQINKIVDSGVVNTEIGDYPGNSNDYLYDANGNMTKDGVKNINFVFHPILNLPLYIKENLTEMFYHYSASGAKLMKHFGTNYTHYVGSVIYENNKISYILTDEGRLVAIGNGTNRTFVYEYTIKDHLGNSRITFTGANLGNSIDIVQYTNYYPFGLAMVTDKNSSSGYSKNKYLYNGKEFQGEFFESQSLDLLDYKWRYYDAQLCRFISIDRLATSYPWYSPYQYAGNEVPNAIDLDGLEPAYLKPDGNFTTARDGQMQQISPMQGSYDYYENNPESASNDPSLGIIGGFVPGVSTVMDIVDLKSSVKEGDIGNITSAIVGFFPGGDFLKAGKKVENATNAFSATKSLNKNSNSAKGNFVLYEINDKDGNILKVGKADADRTNAAGQPTRMKDSERKAQKQYPGSTATVVQKLGQTTTGKAKEAEAARVRAQRSNGNLLPLNKEKDKRYQTK